MRDDQNILSSTCIPFSKLIPSKETHEKPPSHSILSTHFLLHSISPSESNQLRHIRSDPRNNLFAAIPDPQTRSRTLALGITYAAEQGTIDLFIILKLSFSSSTKYAHLFKHANSDLLVEDGLALGVMQICAPDPSEEGQDGEGVSEVGGYIHYEFTGMGFGTEAFKAVIGYAFEVLGRRKVVLETKRGNMGLRAVMRKLGWEDLEKEGQARIGTKEKEESVKWELLREDYLARRRISQRSLTLK